MENAVKVIDSSEITPVCGEGLKRYNILTKDGDGSSHLSFHRVLSEKGRQGSNTQNADQVFYVLDGCLHLSSHGKTSVLTREMVAWIPAGQPFEFNYVEDTTLLVAFSPAR